MVYGNRETEAGSFAWHAGHDGSASPRVEAAGLITPLRKIRQLDFMFYTQFCG
jgi:hypothetical protein